MQIESRDFNSLLKNKCEYIGFIFYEYIDTYFKLFSVYDCFSLLIAFEICSSLVRSFYSISDILLYLRDTCERLLII